MPRPVAEMKPPPARIAMSRTLPALLLLSAAVALAVPADAQRRPDQDAAYQGLRAGSIMPLREIEARYVPRMAGAAYLGPEFDSGAAVYRLKFMRDGRVIWIDVDARTGREIGRSGN